jgi:hypothetical protein
VVRIVTHRWQSSFGNAIRGALLIALVAVTLVVAASKQALAQEGGWTTPVMISTNTVMSWFSDVAVDGWGQPHVVWYSGRSAGGESLDLLMYSTFAGQEWLEPNDVVLTGYGGYTVRPAIAVDGAAMLHATFRGETTIYYTNSPASKAWSASSWAPRKRISGDGTGSAYYSDIAVDEQGGIHVVYNEGVATGDGERWLWFGSLQGGVAYDGRKWRSQGPQAGLGNRQIYAILEDEAGVQWFGTDEGVYRFDGSTWQRWTGQGGSIAQKVTCLVQDVDGVLWFGTDRGVSRYDGEAQWDNWAVYTARSGLPGDTVYAMATDRLGRVWVGTENGLASYVDQIWMSYTPQDGLVAPEVVAVAVDTHGDVWAGTRQGVSHYDGEHWTTYTVEDGLLSDVVTAIAVDRDDMVWVGTEAGLSRFDGRQWTSYTDVARLGSGAVTALMVDSEGAVWVGTETGVSHYDGQTWGTFELPPGFAGQRVTAIAEDQQVNAMCPLCADIFYRHSTDGGRSWSIAVNLSSSFAGSSKPRVHVGNEGSVYVTWEEGEDWYLYGGYPIASMYVYSPDGGNTWTEPTVFSSPLGAPQQITLGVGRSDDLVVVWRPSTEDPLSEPRGLPRPDRFYYQLSGDHGATWSEPQSIPGVIAKIWTPFSLDGYDAATDSAGNVHLLVLGYRYSLDEDLSLMHLVWNGSEWSRPSTIYTSSDPPEWPSIDVGAGNQVYATWFARDERHIHDSERGRYKVWVSSYQASAPAQTPAPVAVSTPTPVLGGLDQVAPTPTSTPLPVIDPDSSGLPPGLYTESDEIVRLALTLSPVVLILLIIVALRLSRRTSHG